MTVSPPLSVIRLNDNESHCLVVVSPKGRPAQRGVHPAEIVGRFELIEGRPDMDPSAFARGKDFTDFLHASIARNGPGVEALARMAKGQHGTYVYVIDGRTPTPQGRVPPEDIIGCFQVVQGQISEETYQRVPSHRLLTEKGFFQLETTLVDALLSDLEAVCGDAASPSHRTGHQG